MTSAPVITGSAEPRERVWLPLPIAKLMRSAPPVPLAVLLAAVIASRRLILPSAPLLAISAAMLVVVPSAVSAAVSTTMVLKVSSSMLVTDTSLASRPL